MELKTCCDNKDRKLTDEDLIALYREYDDMNYINTLYERISPFLKYMCKKIYSSHRNTHNIEFEEVLSLSAFSFIRAIKYYDDSKGFKFSTYLGKCLSRDIFSNLNSYSRKNKELHLDDIILAESKNGTITTLTDNLTDFNVHFEEDIIEKDYNQYLKKIIYNAFNRLNDKDKKIFKLYYLENKSQREIADIYNYSQPTISNEIVKIREKFKILLKGYTELPSFIYNSAPEGDKPSECNKKLPISYKKHMECLSSVEKEIVSLYYDEKLTYADIIKKTGRSKKGIYQILKRSLHKLELAEKGIKLVSNKKSNSDKLPSNFKDYIHYLKPKDQDVIRLRYIEKRKYKDIADKFNISIGNAGNIVRTATNRLIYYICENNEG